MPKESTIRKHAHEELTKQGYVVWWAHHVRYAVEQDIFGVFDACCLKSGEFPRFIQITSKSNISARKKKIEQFFRKHGVECWAEVWGFDDKTKTFKIVDVKL